MRGLPLALLLTLRLVAGVRCDQPAGLTRGKCFEDILDWKQAEETYRAEMHAVPQSAEALTAHARTLVHLRQPFDALIELEEWLKVRPDSIPAAKLYAALCDSVLKDYGRARETLENVVRLAPEDADAWQALGTHHLDRGKFDEAIADFRHAERLRPGDPLILSSLGYSLAQSGDEEAARSSFHKALEIAKQKPDAAVYLLYGDFLLRHGPVKDSLPALTRAIELNPHAGEAYYYRALANEKAMAFPAALLDARKAIEESGERIDAHLVLQRVYRKLGKDAEVRAEAAKIQEIQNATEREQAKGRALRENLNLAEPLLSQHKFGEAIPYYEQIVRQMPSFYEAWFALGVSYAQTGKPLPAQEAFRKYLEYQPLSADGHASYGLLLASIHRNAEARKELEEALKLDPGLDDIRTALQQLPAN